LPLHPLIPNNLGEIRLGQGAAVLPENLEAVIAAVNHGEADLDALQKLQALLAKRPLQVDNDDANPDKKGRLKELGVDGRRLNL